LLAAGGIYLAGITGNLLVQKERAVTRALSLVTDRGIINIGAGCGRTFVSRHYCDLPEVVVNIDLAVVPGCPKCLAVDLEKAALPFGDLEFDVALASHVLEHLPSRADCERAVRELQRVADRVYVAGPSRQSVIAWLVPGHHLWVEEEGGVLYVEERTWWSRAAGRDPREWDGLR